ncbi:hypothetical protein ABEB36_004302 [Hypothenemus hampei]|uniref:Cytochrome P450 n=1 Tax=Hypothenemus hampei TaxID=57062 RepID=A0ABD1F5K8_HYPHA
MLFYVLAGLVAFLFWYKFIRTLDHFTKRGVKQTTPWPLLGDDWPILLGQKVSFEVLKEIYNLYPNARYVGFYPLSQTCLILRDPELIKQLTVKDFDHFTDHKQLIDAENDKLWSANLFALNGQKWKEMRSTLSPSFTSSKMKHMFGVINETAQDFAKYFQDKKENLIEIELKDSFTRYSNDVIASSAFGITVNSLQNPENYFYLTGKNLLKINAFRMICFAVLPAVGKLLRLTFISKVAGEYFKSVIHETIKTREEKGIVRNDMINLLLENKKGKVSNEAEPTKDTGYSTVKEYSDTTKLKAKYYQNLTIDDITSQALIFFIAGFETISTGLSFGTYELAVNPDVQERLRKEIQETHEANNGKVTYETLVNMKYLDMVFTEILRKWPPVPAMDRTCTKNYTIQPVNKDEVPVDIKVGEVFRMPILQLQRDPKYFPNPEKFDPERFSDENKDRIVPYTYIPFGSGPRNCIGSRFALLEGKAVLYHLLLNFRFVTTKRTAIPLKFEKFKLRSGVKGGIWIGLEKL